MARVKRKGDKRKYWMRDRKCAGYGCFAPDLYQIRGATSSGSRDTGRDEAERQGGNP